MAASAPRTFSSVGQISRARVSVALGLAVAGVVVAVVVARAGKATERDAALEAARHLLAVAEEWHATNGETGVIARVPVRRQCSATTPAPHQ